MLRQHIYNSCTRSGTRIRWEYANQLSSGIEVLVRVMQMNLAAKPSSLRCKNL